MSAPRSPGIIDKLIDGLPAGRPFVSSVVMSVADSRKKQAAGGHGDDGRPQHTAGQDTPPRRRRLLPVSGVQSVAVGLGGFLLTFAGFALFHHDRLGGDPVVRLA